MSPTMPITTSRDGNERHLWKRVRVGDVRRLVDATREEAILHHGRQLLLWHARYEVTGYSDDLKECHRHRKAMEALIKGRSACQVARMEEERGLDGR